MTVSIRSFYSKKQLTSLLKKKLSNKEQKEIDEKWSVLISEIRKVLHKDPADPEVQELALRWLELTNEFTQGNTELLKNLHESCEDINESPDDIKNEYLENQDVYEFISRAIKLLYNREKEEDMIDIGDN